MSVQAEISEENDRNLIGTETEVLVEGTSKRDPLVLTGRSPKNQTVHAQIPKGKTIEELQGTIIPVQIEQARAWYLRGKVLSC